MAKKKIQALQTQLASHEVFGQFRYIVIDEKIYFFANDVAKVVDLKNIRKNLAEFPDDEKKLLT